MLEWYKIELGEMLEKAKKDLRKKREGKSQPAAAAAGTAGSSDDEDVEEKKPVEKEIKPEDEQTEEDLEGRIKKIESGLQERQDGMRGGKTLLMEFSIENVQVSPVPYPYPFPYYASDVRRTSAHSIQVVKRRGEKIVAARDGLIGNKRKDRDDETATNEGDVQAGKRKRGGDGKREGKDGKDGKRDRKDRDGKDGKDRSRSKSSKEDAKVTPAPQEKKGIEKEGVSMGSMIGRKRRRKAGK
jgi:nucleolar protein 4